MAVYLVNNPVFQSQGAQLPPPYAAGIHRDVAFFYTQSQCCPVPKCNGNVPCLPVLVFVPRSVFSWLGTWWTGNLVGAPAGVIAKTHACQDIGDQAQASPAGSVVPPQSWAVAIHLA